MKRTTVLVVVVCACVGASAWAGIAVPAELLRVELVGNDTAVCAGGTAERSFEVQWDFMVDPAGLDAYDVQGWSFGVLLENTGAATSYIKTATEHADTAGAGPGGARPSFDTMNFYEAGELVVSAGSTGDGTGLEGMWVAVTQGVVLDFMQQAKIPAPADDIGSLDLVAVVQGTDAGSTTLGFTDAVGSPPTKTVAVVGGGSFAPGEQLGLTIDILGADDPACQSCFYYEADDSEAEENILAPRSDEGTAAVTRTISLQEVPADPAAAASEVQALSMSMIVPAGITLDAVPGADAASAEYFEFQLDGSCMSAALIMEWEEPYDAANVLSALSPIGVVDLLIETIPEEWLGVEDPAAVELALDGCSSVTNVVVVNGESRDICNPDLVVAQSIVPVTQIPFVRGDANADGKYDVADAVFTISWLFRSGPAPSCEDAADVNDDGLHDTSDVVFTLSYLFDVEVLGMMPSEPAMPFPDCGLDMTGGTAASCASYPPCQ